MTQVQTMSKATLNHELAVLMGWTEIRVLLKSDRLMGRDPVDGWATYIPDYAGDPAASLEVQTKAIEINPREYVRNLQELKWECSFGAISKIKVAELMTATPREMAEAALITMMGAK